MGSFINANLFHNIANVLIVAGAGLTAALLASGCTQMPTGALECSASWIDPTYTTGAVAVLSGVKIVVNVFRDGLTGLGKVQPPVQK